MITLYVEIRLFLVFQRFRRYVLSFSRGGKFDIYLLMGRFEFVNALTKKSLKSNGSKVTQSVFIMLASGFLLILEKLG